MPIWKAVVVAIIYFSIAKDCFALHQYGWAAVWFLYAAACLATIAAMRGI